MQASEQTRLGRFFDLHPRLLRSLALAALVWGLGYLTWRIGWSGEGASPVPFAMLLVTELYGIWALGTLTWFSWSRPPAVRPAATPGRSVDVYVCTYDEPSEVIAATLAGCRALTYPHTTWLLDDGRRPEMEELARLAGARYLTRPDNSHAKAGNINAALERTEGELVLMLDADHVPMPDALDAMVGYFDDERMALVQSPHDFFNHDSAQHYAVGRHEQSLFYRVVCPGKDRHGAAYWCGSAALIRRQALLEIGGVATETIAEDFHTTIRLLRHGWRSRYHDEVLVQGLAPHDLDGYLLQRDRWARGNLAVFTLPESPLRARELRPLQRLSYFASLAAYLAPPMRLLLLATLGLVLWTGELPMKISVIALAALWLPSVTLNLSAGAALARGYMKIGETAHYELLTMEVYTRALRCAVLPGHTAFKVTPKQGTGGGGLESVRKLHLVLLCAVLLGAGTVLRLLDLAGIGPDRRLTGQEYPSSQVQDHPLKSSDKPTKAEGKSGDLRRFALAFVQTDQTDNVADQHRFYADSVHFYREGDLSWSGVAAATRRYHQERQNKRYGTEGTAAVTGPVDGGFYIVEQPVSWSRKEGSRQIRGKSVLRLRVVPTGRGDWRITSIDEIGQ